MYFCSDVIWKVVLKNEVENGSHKNVPAYISKFSLPRAFCTWSRICHSPSAFGGGINFSRAWRALGVQSGCINGQSQFLLDSKNNQEIIPIMYDLLP